MATYFRVKHNKLIVPVFSTLEKVVTHCAENQFLTFIIIKYVDDEPVKEYEAELTYDIPRGKISKFVTTCEFSDQTLGGLQQRLAELIETYGADSVAIINYNDIEIYKECDENDTAYRNRLKSHQVAAINVDALIRTVKEFFDDVETVSG